MLNCLCASQAELKHNYNGMSPSISTSRSTEPWTTWPSTSCTAQTKTTCVKSTFMKWVRRSRQLFGRRTLATLDMPWCFNFIAACHICRSRKWWRKDVVKRQKLPNQCDDYDPCCFCFTPSMKVATPISLQPLPTSWIELLTLNWRCVHTISIFVTGHCLSKTVHLSKLKFDTYYTQETTDAIPCIE